MTDQPTLPPANWYPAPDRPSEVRWWDGAAWSDQYAPIDKRAAKKLAKEQAEARRATSKVVSQRRQAERQAEAAEKLATKRAAYEQGKAQHAAAKQAAHKQRDLERATAAYQKALAVWQQQRDAAAQQLELVSTFAGDSNAEGIMLKPGESLYARVLGTSLIEDRAGQGHFEGRSQGISIPIGSIGGRSVRYRVGQSRGHYVAGAPVATAIDVGTLFVTDQRVIFQGAKATRECLFSKLLAYQTSQEGAATFSVSNRQKATVVHYGPQVAAQFDELLELALAHFRGNVPQLVARAQSALDSIDAKRPAPPAAIAP